ncbi:hypothetical protein HW132_23520 [Brasilonema sp. CT11]|nr:hypothetical protein [Brasilonema sp. CT11]
MRHFLKQQYCEPLLCDGGNKVTLWLTPRLTAIGEDLRSRCANTSRLGRETPSGSPDACGGKPSRSTGLTSKERWFTTPNQREVYNVSFWTFERWN